MAVVVLANNKNEVSVLLNKSRLNNQEAMIMVIDLDHSKTVNEKDNNIINDDEIEDIELYIDYPFKGTKEIVDEFGNMCPVIDMTPCIGIHSQHESTLIGATDHEAYEKAVKTIKDYFNAKAKNAGSDMMTIMTLLEEVLEFDMMLICVVVSATGEIKELHELQNKGIVHVFNNNTLVSIPVLEFQEYIENPKEIENAKDILKCIQQYIISDIRLFLSDKMTCSYYRYTRRIFDAITTTSSDSHRVLRALLYEYGEPIESLPLPVIKNASNADMAIHEEAQMRGRLYKLVMSKWHSILKSRGKDYIRHMNRYEMMIWLIRFGRHAPQNLEKKKYRAYLEDILSEIEDKLNGRRKDVYEHMSTAELRKELINLGVNDINPYDEREKAISKIVSIKRGVDVIPDEEELYNSTKEHLWDIFYSHFYDAKVHNKVSSTDFKNFSKKSIIKLIIDSQYNVSKDNISTHLTIEDVNDLSKEELIEKIDKLCESNKLKKEVNKIINNGKYKNKLVNLFKLKYRFQINGKEFKTKDEMEAMDKESLVRYGNLQFNAFVNVDMRKKDIIEDIMRAQKEEKKFENKIAKKSEITYDNLKKLPTDELYRIAKEAGIAFKYCAKKKALIEAIIKSTQSIDDEPKPKKNEPKEKKDDPYKEIKKYRKERLKGNSLGMTLLTENDLKESEDDMSDLLKMVEKYQKEIGEYEEDYIDSQVKELQRLQDKVSDLNKNREVKSEGDRKMDKNVEEIKENMPNKNNGKNYYIIDGTMLYTYLADSDRIIIDKPKNNRNNNQRNDNKNMDNDNRNRRHRYDDEEDEMEYDHNNKRESKYARMNAKLSKIFRDREDY